MATSLGFNGVGNKNQGFSGGTGGGQIQPLQLRAGPNGVGVVNDGSGGILNYLQGLIKSSPATQGAQVPVPAPTAPAATGQEPSATQDEDLSGGQSSGGGAGKALAGQAVSGALGGGL